MEKLNKRAAQIEALARDKGELIARLQELGSFLNGVGYNATYARHRAAIEKLAELLLGEFDFLSLERLERTNEKNARDEWEDDGY